MLLLKGTCRQIKLNLDINTQKIFLHSLVNVCAHRQRAHPQHRPLHSQPGVDEIDAGLHASLAVLVVASHVPQDEEAAGDASNLGQEKQNFIPTFLEVETILVARHC